MKEVITDEGVVLGGPALGESNETSTHAQIIHRHSPNTSINEDTNLLFSAEKEKSARKSPTTKSKSRGTNLTLPEDTVSSTEDSIAFSFLTENNLQNSMSEQDIKDVLFEAGYSINEIEEIVAANAGKDGVEDSLNSSISVDSVNSSTQS